MLTQLPLPVYEGNLGRLLLLPTTLALVINISPRSGQSSPLTQTVPVCRRPDPLARLTSNSCSRSTLLRFPPPTRRGTDPCKVFDATITRLFRECVQIHAHRDDGDRVKVFGGVPIYDSILGIGHVERRLQLIAQLHQFVADARGQLDEVFSRSK